MRVDSLFNGLRNTRDTFLSYFEADLVLIHYDADSDGSCLHFRRVPFIRPIQFTSLQSRISVPALNIISAYGDNIVIARLK